MVIPIPGTGHFSGTGCGSKISYRQAIRTDPDRPVMDDKAEDMPR